MYVRLSQSQCTNALEYTITNCHRLKYLCYCSDELPVILSLSSGCRLQELYLESHYVCLSAPSAHVLSAHGELEQVVLYVNSITTSAITTLTSNSPNLILLFVATRERLVLDENSVRNNDYMDTVSKIFSYHKILTAGDFILVDEVDIGSRYEILSRFDTNLNSFWMEL